MRRSWKISVIAAAVTVLLVGGLAQASTRRSSQAQGVATVASASNGQLRTYFIAADEVLWDYAPQGKDEISGHAFTPEQGVFTKNGPSRVFKNNTAQPASIHSHGVFYQKSSEGAPYADGTSGADKADDAVPTGATHTYDWKVPERAGPGPMDSSSVLWMYHSHTDEVADTSSGLTRPMVITAAGKADPTTGAPTDVDREMFSYYTVENENKGHYLDRNLKELAQAPRVVAAADAEAFEESNLMHSINGYVYGNGPVLSMVRGQRVRWYTFTLGTEVDLHTPHWHGSTVTTNGMRSDMIQLLPGMMTVSDMTPDNPGTWLLHCHVNDHIVAGIQTRYRVTE